MPKGRNPYNRIPEPEPEESDEEIMDEEDEEDEEKQTCEEILNALPLRQRRAIYALKNNSRKMNEMREKYDKELCALELKYTGLTKPLFEERRKIVTGERDVKAEEIAAGETAAKATSKVEALDEEEEEEKAKPRRGVGAKKAQKGDDEKANGTGDEKGVPEFWLTVLENHEAVMDSITERDREALISLKDITLDYVDGDPYKGYVLSFYFGENRFFSNSVLTKKYFQEREHGEPILAKTEGTEIQWKSKADNLTVTIKKKQQKHRTKKTVRTIEQEVKCESFFNFFSPPRIPQDDDSEDEEEDDVDYEDLEERIEYDYEIGNCFKDRLIPKAVDYFTGAACHIGELAGMGANVGLGVDDDDDAPEAIPVESSKESKKVKGKGDAKQEDCKQQ